MYELDLTHAPWRKSSYSGGNGNCVEVAHVHAQWRKSSRSGAGACVEIAHLPEAIAVRDSKDPAGPKLIFTPYAWASFVESTKSGRFLGLSRATCSGSLEETSATVAWSSVSRA